MRCPRSGHVDSDVDVQRVTPAVGSGICDDDGFTTDLAGRMSQRLPVEELADAMRSSRPLAFSEGCRNAACASARSELRENERSRLALLRYLQSRRGTRLLSAAATASFARSWTAVEAWVL